MAGQDEAGKGVSDSNDRALGRLEAQIEILTDTVKTHTRESKEGRARIYKELEEIRSDARETKTEVKAVKEDFEAHKPVLSEIGKWKERFTGMVIFAMLLWTSLGGAIGVIWSSVKTKIGL
jgi:chromosome segregation ATPase